MKKKPYTPPAIQVEPLEDMPVLAETELMFSTFEYTEEALSNQQTWEWESNMELWDDPEE